MGMWPATQQSVNIKGDPLSKNLNAKEVAEVIASDGSDSLPSLFDALLQCYQDFENEKPTPDLQLLYNLEYIILKAAVSFQGRLWRKVPSWEVYWPPMKGVLNQFADDILEGFVYFEEFVRLFDLGFRALGGEMYILADGWDCSIKEAKEAGYVPPDVGEIMQLQRVADGVHELYGLEKVARSVDLLNVRKKLCKRLEEVH
ncbi:hypothetical protein LOZ66_006860 [Ophidiomyces ophidiicola]|nr:hypothetical protein LOZ66_006860 [Ophidiomyces ophidiicola]